MIYYLYENHLGGGVYWSEYERDWKDLYCETCGDADWRLGTFKTADELKNLLEDFDSEYVREVIAEFMEEVKK